MHHVFSDHHIDLQHKQLEITRFKFYVRRALNIDSLSTSNSLFLSCKTYDWFSFNVVSKTGCVLTIRYQWYLNFIRDFEIERIRIGLETNIFFLKSYNNTKGYKSTLEYLLYSTLRLNKFENQTKYQIQGLIMNTSWSLHEYILVLNMN